jgi:hypothetical protein
MPAATALVALVGATGPGGTLTGALTRGPIAPAEGGLRRVDLSIDTGIR